MAARVCGQGAAVTVAACDVADRTDLAGLLARLAAAGTAVRGVIHAAVVCAAKAAGAMNLHELLGDSVDTFVLWSSIAGIWGGRDHAAYAAANAALDALAQYRRARGLAAISIPWSVWQPTSPNDIAVVPGYEPEQLIRRGLPFLAWERAFTGLRQVLDGDEVCTAVANVDWDRFVPVFTSARPSPLIAGVTEARQIMETDRKVVVPEPERGGLAGRLAGLPAADQERLVLGVICEQVAAVLGYASADAVRPGMAFRDLGFDSVTALELRDKLTAATGLRLPATLVFDYPTPRALAGWLRAETAPGDVKTTVPLLAGLDELENGLSSADVDPGTRERITLRLEAILSHWKSRQPPADSSAVAEKLQSATPEEILQFIDNELRVPKKSLA
jgi:acyl carrier protein